MYVYSDNVHHSVNIRRYLSIVYMIAYIINFKPIFITLNETEINKFINNS